jgi:hypothetical protein
MGKILIAGGSGLIGQQLTNLLIADGFDVAILSRTENLNKPVKTFYWSPSKGEIDHNAFDNVSCIINLAGENIAGKRWTKTQKEKIISSRVESTNLLYQTVVKHKLNINTYISASAVGYYGAITSEKIFMENEPPYKDFLGDVCKQWEHAANQFENIGIRTFKLRTGVVFTKNGGALEKLIKPINFYLGAPLGNGKQYVPWIHIDDLCQMYLFVLKNNLLPGAYNAVAPEHVTNKELTYKLAKKLNKPILIPSVPAFALKLILGEMSKMVLYGSRVSPEKIMSSGFNFKYNTLNKALNQLL